MENNFDVAIVERDPRTFHFHPANPRDHSDEAVATLAESIQEDPLYFRGRPVLLSDRTGELVVIGGEGRTRAALLLGLDTVPSVVFHGLDEESEIRIMQKDNSHSGKWNEKGLQALAERWGKDKLRIWSPDVHFATPISEDEVRKMFEEHNAPKVKPNYLVVEVPKHIDIDAVKTKVVEAVKDWPECIVK